MPRRPYVVSGANTGYVSEYAFHKPAGIRRMIVCGDSMAAGQFVSNVHRFSELLERANQWRREEGDGPDKGALLPKS